MTQGDPKPPAKEDSVTRQLGSFASVGLEFLLAILLPGALGYWLDTKWHTTPWLMLVGGAFGFAVGLYKMLQTAKRTMR